MELGRKYPMFLEQSEIYGAYATYCISKEVAYGNKLVSKDWGTNMNYIDTRGSYGCYYETFQSSAETRNKR